MARLAKGKSLV